MATSKEYTTEHIRNVVVVGHGGSGKTSLVDALCFAAGTSRRRGSVDEGTALTMHTPEELDHGMSLQLTLARAEYQDTKINLLDTPGFLDFAGEVRAAVRVADAAIVVVSATDGVEVGTQRVWRYCSERDLPRIVFISGMDRDRADFQRTFAQVRALLTDGALPVEIPMGEGSDFRGIINLFSERAHLYREGTLTGEYDEMAVPEEYSEQEAVWETELQETLATTDEALLEAYLEGGHISRDEAIEAMALGMATGDIVPVFCGAPTRSYGVRALLRKVVELCPGPAEAPPEIARLPGSGEERTIHATDAETLAALVFKTVAEPHVGELSYVRLFSGTVRRGMEVVNASDGALEKLNHLSLPMGRERQEVGVLHAGDIGVVPRLKHTHTNDTLCDPSRPVRLAGIEFPPPDTAVALRGETRSDEDKLGEVLPRITEEDPSFVGEFDSELHQTLARGLGEMHLQVHFERMARKYGVAVVAERPRIAYRETLTTTAEGQGRHRKQSGGRGQFGDCSVRLSPLPRGGGYDFVDSIKGGAIPSKYLPSVDKGIREAAARGVVAGYPVVDFRAEVFDGSQHAVDSSDVAFQVAGSLAFRTVAARCAPVLLEPVVEVSVTTPDDYMGEVMGDLTARRGKVQGMETRAGRTVVRAVVPEAELYRYAAALRSMTQGRGHHTRTPAGYEPVPEELSREIAGARGEAAEG